MTLREILDEARRQLSDEAQPYLWSDSELTAYLNAAINELAETARPFFDGPAVARPSGLTVTPTGTAGATAYAYKVSALSGTKESLPCEAVATATGNATLTGANYNALSWTAVLGASSYKIYRSTASGTPATTGLIGTATGTTFDDTGIAISSATIPTSSPWQIAVSVSVADFALDTRILEVNSAKLASQGYPLTKKTAAWIESAYPSWRSDTVATNSIPLYFCTDYMDGYITIHPRSASADTLDLMQIFRLPMSQMALTSPTTEPELHFRHHFKLVDGVLARAYKKKDSQTYDPEQGAKHEIYWRKFVDEINKGRIRMQESRGFLGLNKGAI